MTSFRVSMLALAYLVGTLGHGGKLVLCITDNGHVALGSGLDVCCEAESDDGPPGSRAHPTRGGDTSPDTRCDCCVAIPIPTTRTPPHVASGESRFAGTDATSIAFAVAAPSVARPQAAVRAVAIPPPLPPPLASLRTVVFLS